MLQAETNGSKSKILLLSCLVFLLFFLLLPTAPQSFFSDPDTGWHIATGDLIRATRAVPTHDTWAFTSGSQRWLNASWGFDAAVSWFFAHWSFQGIILFNSLLLSLTLAVVFAHCLLRSHNGIASFITLLVLMLCVVPVSIRSHQVSYLMIAVYSLILSQFARNALRPAWLTALPVLMIVWANMHGAFLVGFFLIGMHGLFALIEKNWRSVMHLALTGTASLIACLLNPYGIDIFEATWRSIGSVALPMIREWRSVNLSLDDSLKLLYAGTFVYFALKPSTILKSEKAIGYVWMLLGLSSVRHLPIFGIVSAPVLAQGISRYLKPEQKRTPLAERICLYAERLSTKPFIAATALAICVLMPLLMFMTPIRAFYTLPEQAELIRDMSSEVAFIKTHYPESRFLNSYDIGGPLVFYGRGQVPLFIDGRTDAAYPPQVILDYMAFNDAKTDTEQMLEHYGINGVIAFKGDLMLIDRFKARQGWHQAFEGANSVIYVRDSLDATRPIP